MTKRVGGHLPPTVNPMCVECHGRLLALAVFWLAGNWGQLCQVVFLWAHWQKSPESP